LSGNPEQTLHRRIRADLEGRIRTGEWTPGYRIPTEAELMAGYSCSRMTVSKAITALVQAGLVERRKKAGSFVARPRVQTAVLEIPDLPGLIKARGEAYRFELLIRRSRPPDPSAPQEGALPESSRVLELSGTHYAADAPFALEWRTLNLAAVPDAQDVAFDETPPGTWLLQHVAWTQARHRIMAVSADAKMARRLNIREKAACLQVERLTFRADEWITFVRVLFPGDRYDLVASFGPSR
jgi:GntR family histidine utilization transcriptional repressor